LTDKQHQQAIEIINKHKVGKTWDVVGAELGYAPAYLWMVAQGKRPPSKKLLRALGVVKPEKRTDIRIRMTVSDAREIVDHQTIPLNVVNRIRYALWGIQ
jgi:hypothetical protein